MAKGKQYVFSARTIEEGLKRLSNLKKERGLSWDVLVIEAVCTHYGLDRDVMMLSMKTRLGKSPKESKTKNPKAET